MRICENVTAIFYNNNFFFQSNFRAPLSVRCNNNSNDRPGSEYSLPPSYRSRNHNSRPPTIGGCDSPNNTIIGNLNELACISSTMTTTRTATTATESIIPITHEINQQQTYRTSIISDTFSESIVTNSIDDDLNNLKISKIIEKVELDDMEDIVKISNENLNNKNEQDLVTIVTISGCIDNETTTNGEIDILANL